MVEPSLGCGPWTPAFRRILGKPANAASLRDWLDELRAILRRPGGYDDPVALINCVQAATDTPDGPLIELFNELDSTAKETYMTIAESYEAKGEAKGRTAGLAEGLEEGFTKGLPGDWRRDSCSS